MTGALYSVRVGVPQRQVLKPLLAIAIVGLTLVAGATASAASSLPTVTGLGPNYGPSTGGTSVVIVGKNFAMATAVDFGTTPATSFMVVSSTSITAVSPAGTGIVDVVVATPSGTSKTNSSDKFDYGPSVSCFSGQSTGCALSPSHGPSAGGTTVTISGTNFTGATAVNFGSTALARVPTGPPGPGQFVIVADNQIVADSPAGVGDVDVTVVNPGGTSRTSSADKFNYAPSITCPIPPTSGCPVDPSNGPPTGGTDVTISGTNFTGATAVNFGTAALTPTMTDPPGTGNFLFVSDNEIIANSPAGSGVVNVAVTTPGGSSSPSSSDEFSYAPTVTGITPAFGPATGGTTVTITGSGFTNATAVDFGTTAATSFFVVSDTSITSTSPPGKVPSVNVTVTTPGGTSVGGTASLFGYAPVVALVKPGTGVGTGGTKVTIIGMDFKGVTAVDFGSTPANSFSLKSSKRITAYAPDGEGAGVVNVTVESEAGSSPVVPTDEFDYAPTVGHVSPSHGSPSGGTSVTITGKNFTGVTVVEFGSSPARFTVETTKKITATSPGGAGTVDVTVSTVGGTSPLSSSDQFTY